MRTQEIKEGADLEQRDGDQCVRELEREKARLDSISRRDSWLRLLFFGLCILGLAAATESSFFFYAVAVPGAAFFVIVIGHHGRIVDRLRRVEDEITLTDEERLRVAYEERDYEAPCELSGASPLERGERVYEPEAASYAIDPSSADDLGLLRGRRSLLGFLDWTSTFFGRQRLVRSISRPLRRADDIHERQKAVAEIAARSEARRDLLLAVLPLRRHDLAPLAQFLGRKSDLSWLKQARRLVLTVGNVPLVIVATAIALRRFELLGLLVPCVVVNLIVIATLVRHSNPARDRILLLRPLLGAWQDVRSALARAQLEVREWRQIDAAIGGLETLTKRLSRYVDLLSLHDFGIVFEILNALTLWELRFLPSALSAVERHRGELASAAGAIGEMEAVISLATPLAEQKSFSLPEVLDAELPSVRAAAMGHPLLPPSRCVQNKVCLDDKANLWILTGSNMAGKSTYLKAVGTNVLLATIGGPVCGREFRCTPLILQTDVNVRDSLDDGKSYFQVEVERVLRTLEMVSQERHVLALFDELFRGTNSAERLAISRAVLKYFRDSGALMIVATHDVQLTELVDRDRERGMLNHHLLDEMRDGQMHFDYRLREGVSPRRNAIRVLSAQGYPTDVVSEAEEFLRRSRGS